MLDALALVRRHLDSKLHCYPSEESVPLDGVVPIAWRDVAIERDALDRARINRIGKLERLQPVSYVKNADPKFRTDFGFIAQDVQPIYPDLAKTDPPACAR